MAARTGQVRRTKRLPTPRSGKLRWALGLGLLSLVLYRREYRWLASLSLRHSLKLLQSPLVTGWVHRLGYAQIGGANTAKNSRCPRISDS
jgi:hypothetical protein